MHQPKKMRSIIVKFPKIYYMNPYSKDGDFLGVGVGEFCNAKELNN